MRWDLRRERRVGVIRLLHLRLRLFLQEAQHHLLLGICYPWLLSPQRVVFYFYLFNSLSVLEMLIYRYQNITDRDERALCKNRSVGQIFCDLHFLLLALREPLFLGCLVVWFYMLILAVTYIIYLSKFPRFLLAMEIVAVKSARSYVSLAKRW